MAALTTPMQQQYEAYCACCPSRDDVETLLQACGLTLVFQLPAVTRRRVEISIPAQYHFAAPDGTEVLYLAGRDVGDSFTRLRPHASRFWLIAGGNPTMTQCVLATLATRWGLQWHASAEKRKDKGQPHETRTD